MPSITHLIPFKVRICTFEELPIEWDSPYPFYKKSTNTGLYFLERAYNSTDVSKLAAEFEKKMIPNPHRTAFEKVYKEWVEDFAGEFIVIGKQVQGYSTYITAQPCKLTRLIPTECCIFIGILNTTEVANGN